MTPEELRNLADKGEADPQYGPSLRYTDAIRSAADTIEKLQRENERLTRMAGNVDFIIAQFNVSVAEQAQVLKLENRGLQQQVEMLRAELTSRTARTSSSSS